MWWLGKTLTNETKEIMNNYRVIVIGMTVFVIFEASHFYSHTDHVDESTYSTTPIVMNGGYYITGSYGQPSGSFYYTGSLP